MCRAVVFLFSSFPTVDACCRLFSVLWYMWMESTPTPAVENPTTAASPKRTMASSPPHLYHPCALWGRVTIQVYERLLHTSQVPDKVPIGVLDKCTGIYDNEVRSVYDHRKRTRARAGTGASIFRRALWPSCWPTW